MLCVSIVCPEPTPIFWITRSLKVLPFWMGDEHRGREAVSQQWIENGLTQCMYIVYVVSIGWNSALSQEMSRDSVECRQRLKLSWKWRRCREGLRIPGISWNVRRGPGIYWNPSQIVWVTCCLGIRYMECPNASRHFPNHSIKRLLVDAGGRGCCYIVVKPAGIVRHLADHLIYSGM